MNVGPRSGGGWLVLVLSLLVSASPLHAQAVERENRGPEEAEVADRPPGLDPDLLAIVEQIVGLRVSERSLLADLSEQERARVLDAVTRLLAPPPGPDARSEEPAEASVEAPAQVAGEVADASPTTLEPAEAPGRSAAAEGGDGAAGPPDLAPPERMDVPDPAEPSSSSSAEPRDSSSGVDVDSAPAVRAADDSVACPAWLVWDTNEDRVLSGADRYWRHFVVWVDDGDGVAEADEMQDSFELGLRKLDLDLRSYEGAKESTGVVERRQVAGLERLRVELLRGRNDYGVLAIDLDGMVRGQAPRLRLRSADGESIRELQDGYVPVQEGLEVEQVFGNQTRWRPLLCDR